MVTVESMRVRFPEFVSVSEARIQMFIDDGLLMCDANFWGDLYDRAVSYLAAHYIDAGSSSKASGSGASSRGILTDKLFDAVTTYSDALLMAAADNEYLSTSYGGEYLNMLKRKSGIMVV